VPELVREHPADRAVRPASSPQGPADRALAGFRAMAFRLVLGVSVLFLRTTAPFGLALPTLPAQDAGMTIEEALRDMRERIALLGYIASSAAINPEIPDPNVLAGIAGLCEEIEQRTYGIARTVPVDVLDAEIKAQRRR